MADTPLSRRALLLSVLALSAAPGCARGRKARGLDDAPAPRGWPVAHPNLRVSSRFGDARGGRRHKGIDLECPAGTPVHATAPGIVTFSGTQGAYGDIVVIDHGGGYSTAYAHLSRRALRAGDPVRRGDIVGAVGRTGNATAPHLHYEVRRNGEAINPEPYLR